ncbi:F-type conjugal transfer protein TrbB [Superficieibacter sp. 1612_C1]|jgi:type-F conjugative transfer system pilin assembly thiol-disulfide isomerase TrbB|uniref:F-type conjugal transfer protein TrbB n=1 Tax=Superficieibacter sp. 1612_C1 TaxID=2780382 RepID=UPI001883597E|nr:F-type conjugal transfer protein TrbB [Superficieibacter sp. 1612_C1]
MKSKEFFFLLMMLPVLAIAGTREELAALEAGKTGLSLSRTPAGKAPVPVTSPANLMALPDGRRTDMKNYAVVLFMQSHCQYSAKFDPTLKAWADQHGIRVYPYTLDGGGDVAFPNPMIPRKTDRTSPLADEIITFFGNGLPIATPTAFVVNVNTLNAYPLTQGVMEIPALENRYASLIQADMDQTDPALLPPMPSGLQATQQ